MTNAGLKTIFTDGYEKSPSKDTGPSHTLQCSYHANVTVGGSDSRVDIEGHSLHEGTVHIDFSFHYRDR